jgi:hypothetical protein
MTELTNRQILDAMRDALEETARRIANGELDQSGVLSRMKKSSERPVDTTVAPDSPILNR